MKGIIQCSFQQEIETGDMTCKIKIGSETGNLTFETLTRVYLAIGAHIHKVNQATRYGIETDEDNERVVEEINNRLKEE